jgi:hypothetical protein
MSSPSVLWSSPIKGPRDVQLATIRRKAIKKREATSKAQRQDSGSDSEDGEIGNQRQHFIEQHASVLSGLREHGIEFGSLAEFVFDPSFGNRNVQWEQFFRKKGRATQILDWWVSSSNSDSGRAEVHEWAVNYIMRAVGREAETMTRKGILRSPATLDQEELTGFNFEKIYSALSTTYGVITTKIIERLTRSTRQVRRGLSALQIAKKQAVSLSLFLL